MIEQNNYCEIEASSSIYESSPYGDVEQGNFLNAVIKIKTYLDLKDLFHFLKTVEMKVGRKITTKWGPREIDLDILFFNDLVFSDDEITIPHKDLLNRDFVIVPLIELEPEIIHPGLKKKISEISIFKNDFEHSSVANKKTNIIRKISRRVLIK